MEHVLVAVLTMLGTLVATYFGVHLQDRAARKAELRQAVLADDAARRAMVLALLQRERENIILTDRQAKLELIGLFTELLRRLDFMAVFGHPKWSEVRASSEAVESFLDEGYATSVRKIGDQISEKVDLVAHPAQRQVLLVCRDIAVHWREFETYHGTDWLIQMLVGRGAATGAVEILGALLRGENVPRPSISLCRRLPNDGTARALRRFSADPAVTGDLVASALSKPIAALSALPS